MAEPVATKSLDEAGPGEYTPYPLRVVFLILVIGGVLLAAAYILGYTNLPQVAMLDISYYFLIFALFIPGVFLTMPARKGAKRVPWYDLVLAVFSFAAFLYLFFHGEEISIRSWLPPSALQFGLSLGLVIVAAEAGRRMAGLPFLIIIVAIGLYPIYCSYLPGLLWGQSFPFSWVVVDHVTGGNGFTGLPGKVMGDILIGYLVFAGLLVASGGGEFFLNLALGLLGRFRGGAAKVAVVGSGLFGSLSGSIFANIVATGSVTIPTMKRTGYPPHYAAAIETTASTGGAFMPPIMGATAFIMCILLDVPYAAVIVAAALPAILYYFGLFAQVDSYAARAGLRGLPRQELPSLKETLKKGWPFIAVIFFLVFGLLYMRWAARTPFYAAGLLILLSFTNRERMMTPRRMIQSFDVMGRLITRVTAALLGMALLINGLYMTGGAAALTTGLIALGEGNIPLILLIGWSICYIMGMVGVASAAYIALAVTLAPAIVKMSGINPIAVHLAIYYWTMTAPFTLPVAPAAFVAAGMAEAKPFQTCLTAMRLGIAIYFVPFFFIYNNALVLSGPISDTLYVFPQCLLGILLIAAGLESYLLKLGRVPQWARLPLIAAGFLIGFPNLTTTMAGAPLALLTIAMILLQRRMRRRT